MFQKKSTHEFFLKVILILLLFFNQSYLLFQYFVEHKTLFLK